MVVAVATACSSRPSSSSSSSFSGTATAIAADRAGTAVAVTRAGEVSIVYTPADGPTTQIDLGKDAVVALALDETSIYWADVSRVRRVPRGAKTIHDLQGPDPAIGALALDPITVYWTHEGTVVRVAKDGGAIEIAWAPKAIPAKLAVTVAGVYVGASAAKANHDTTEIWRLGGAAPLATTDGVLVAMASDRDRVVWTTHVGPMSGGTFHSYALDPGGAAALDGVPGRVAAVAGPTVISVADGVYATTKGASTRVADAGAATVVGREVVVAVNANDRVTLTRAPLP